VPVPASRTQVKANWVPSGENVGKLSEPGNDVSGAAVKALGSGGDGHSATAVTAAAAPSTAIAP
jgi:hypothetical protein